MTTARRAASIVMVAASMCTVGARGATMRGPMVTASAGVVVERHEAGRTLLELQPLSWSSAPDVERLTVLARKLGLREIQVSAYCRLSPSGLTGCSIEEVQPQAPRFVEEGLRLILASTVESAFLRRYSVGAPEVQIVLVLSDPHATEHYPCIAAVCSVTPPPPVLGTRPLH